ncbi:MAG: hypothetical protein A3H42_02320 [Deltaproteobacteria bacterium RIFCSPLOWO2_02_FULL_46_8]|nr:MAG: hypothetical protein A3H42_02320 [Deltaproteobacteria bacterium RIFCSPLOWO2_02_FULL_46_8]
MKGIFARFFWGAGTGREVFAFQRLGFEAVGVEQVDQFVECAVSHAKKNNIPVVFIKADLAKFDYVSHFQEKSFDCVTIFNIVYSYIPSREWRINLLRQMRQILKPGGHCLVNFVMAKPSLREQRWSPFIRIFGKMLNWHSEFEIGDRLHEGVPIYQHNFPSYEAVESEALEAGFQQIEFFNFLGNAPHAVLSTI